MRSADLFHHGADQFDLARGHPRRGGIGQSAAFHTRCVVHRFSAQTGGADKLFYTSATRKVGYEKWYPDKG